ncbi:MAG: amino acid adenylation domain-containing protein [Verrucomicrobiota bacterium]
MNPIAENVATLSAQEKRALLQRLLQTNRSEPGMHPLSFAQRRLWFLDQLHPCNAALNLPEAWRIAGPLDIDALRQSINLIVARHEALRTTFTSIEGRAMQCIAPALDLENPVVDLQTWPAESKALEARRLVQEEAERPFDLSAGPLLRAGLIRLQAGEHLLVLNFHHIVFDAWSSGVFMKELAQAYESLRRGRSPALSDLPIQYADFANWQRQRFEAGHLQAAVDFWKAKLAGDLPRFVLPPDHPRPETQTFRGKIHRFDLPSSLADRLKTLARMEGATLFMALLTAFKALLHRYSGEEDIVVGTPTAGRTHKETEPLIGFFVNTLVLRTRVKAEQSFRQLLREVRDGTLGAFAHQDLPFELIVEAVQPQRTLRHGPLVQAMFVLQNAEMTGLELDGTRCERIPLHNGTAQFDLMLTLFERDGGFEAEIEFNADLYEAGTIEQFAARWMQLLRSIAADPDKPISKLSWLTTLEREQLLEQGTASRSIPRSKTLVELFESQVNKTPDGIALQYESESLTYRELNLRANRLAHHLRQQGVAPDDLVGLSLDRSLDMVIGIVAILKAGGAYVPIDPAAPKDRIAFLLDDAGVHHLITTSSLAERLELADSHGQARSTCRNVICLDRDWPMLERESEANPQAPLTPDHLAYVIYTSGSTGKPKGVLVTHYNVVRLFEATEPWFGFHEQDVWTLFHSYAFDFSVWELWGALLYGGRLIVVPYLTSRSPSAFYDLLTRERVTVLNQTPSAFRQLIQEEETRDTPAPLALRYVIFGGEALDLPMLQPWFDRHGDKQPQLVNMYGITETTVHVSYRSLTQADLHSSSRIGCAIPDLDLYLLDSCLQPVPPGVPGEIYVGGGGVARGYLNRTELTAARFIPHPFRPGARLYKSGDLARRLADGDIEYLGRMDHQMKIRGFRIEPAEIEAVLNRHPAVRTSLVLARGTSEKRLIAYLVPRTATGLKISEIRQAAQKELPEYMVPSAFVVIGEFPLTHNGKLDRDALPEPEETRPDLEGRYVEPRTRVEKTLAEIWQAVLRLDRVGIHDNFFELGGDSILSIQIVARANRAGMRVTPRHLFQFQTIAELATVAEERAPAASAATSPMTGPVPLTPIQHWFFELPLVNPHHWNQAMEFDLYSPVELTAWRETVRHLTHRHDALRLRFDKSGDHWVQTCREVSGEPVPFAYFDLAALGDTEQEKVIAQESAQLQSSLRMDRGPLWQVAVFNCGTQRPARVVIIVHHVAIDLVSWSVLVDELRSAYEQRISGQAIVLDPPAASFQQWARILAGAESQFAGDIAYWKALAGQLRSPIPVDFPEGVNIEKSMAMISLQFSKEQTTALIKECLPECRAQMHELVLAALAQAWGAATGQSALWMDLEGHGRDAIDSAPDLSRTIGWFTTIYPVQFKVHANNSGFEALRHVQHVLRDVPHRGLSFGVLRYLSRKTEVRAALASLQPEISFNHLGHIEPGAEPGATLQLRRSFLDGSRDPRGQRPHRIEIISWLASHQLCIEWRYSNAGHRRSTIQKWADETGRRLREFPGRHSPARGACRAEDFPEAGLSQQELDELLAELR